MALKIKQYYGVNSVHFPPNPTPANGSNTMFFGTQGAPQETWDKHAHILYICADSLKVHAHATLN